ALGVLVWSALLEPLPGPAWFETPLKLLYVAAMWVAGSLLANVLLWTGHVLYPAYGGGPRSWGLAALDDQRAGGGLMLLEGSAVLVGVAGWLALRWWRESEARQQLV